MSGTRAATTGISVFIIDDHPLYRDGLVRLLARMKGFSVCGEAEDAETALKVLAGMRPHLTLLDMSLRDKNGFELLKLLPTVAPDTRVLVLSMHEEEVYAERALRAGARGYVMKQEAADKISLAIKTVSDGKIYLSERMTTAALSNISQRQPKATTSAVAKLTERELDVLRCTGQGKASREVAEELSISVKTVDTHRAHLRQKLGLKTGTELVRYAVRWVEEESL